jgi:glycosyltransferase involved in cell wall biosynthesis
MDNTFVTVVTAGWRTEGVKRVIDCLDKQTVQNFHHIIVNDNNPDLRFWLKEQNYFHDSEMRHVIDFHQRTHFFGAFARNCGVMMAFSYFSERIKTATDDFWIIFLDDDNLWEPNHLERFMEAHQAHPEATMIGWDMEIRSTINPDYRHNVNCFIAPQQFDMGSFAIKHELFDKYGYFMAGLGENKRKITYDALLYNKMAEGEGSDKVFVSHYRPCTFAFFSRDRK